MRRPPLLLAAFVAVVAILLLWAAGALGATTTLTPTLDTSVDASYPATTFASGTDLVAGYPRQTLRIDGDPTRFALLRFEVPALYGTPTAATLRLYKRVGSPSEPMNVKSVDCSAWSAATTYNTRPARGVIVGSFSGYTTSSTGAYTSAAVGPAYVGSGAPACFAVDKDIARSTWITLDSSEQTYKPQLVVTSPDAPPPPPTDTDGDGVADGTDGCPNEPGPASNNGCPVVNPPPAETPGVPAPSCPQVSATPANLKSIIAASDCVNILAQPGTYSNLSMKKSSNTANVSIKCAVTAKGAAWPARSSGGCVSAGESTIESIHFLTIEGFQFVGGNINGGSADYGLALYDESPDVNMHVRVANNVFSGNFDHDVSTKERVEYTEVVGNWFYSCQRHCWEIGQNGNIRDRQSTTGTAIFKNNTLSSEIQGVTQRYNLNLSVEGNDFRGVTGYSVINEPYWALYPYPAPGDLYVPGTPGPYVPLRTRVVANTFAAGNRLQFQGRGVIDDVVLLQGNTGTAPACSRPTMRSDAVSAHINEQTTAGPQLDPASDRSC